MLLALLVLVLPARAVTYSASLVHPAGYPTSGSYGIDGSMLVGTLQTPVDYYYHAWLSTGTPGSVVDLHPAGAWESHAYGISGSSEVGMATFLNSGSAWVAHAVLWHGTAASVVDLHPDGYSQTYAHDVSGDYQVGEGDTVFYHLTQGLLWNGTAASVVNLTPANFDESAAYGIDGNSQVGRVSKVNPIGPVHPHAALWHGTAASFVDLHSSAFTDSTAGAVGEGYQGGWVMKASFGSNPHAALWKGSAGSYVDLHPAAYSQSSVSDIGDGHAVGTVETAAVYPDTQAALWTLTGGAASFVNLHALLTGLGTTFQQSAADSISADGVIVGTAITSSGSYYAVKWTPNYIPGDFNHDDKVDSRDYITWRKGAGTKYGDADYTAWRTHLGQSGSGYGASLSPATIPEPTSGLLLALGLAGSSFVRLRRGRR
jgi:hypothetical protein